MKSLKDISWQVTEPEYRADPALSYSSLGKYDREGFSCIPRLFDKLETPSLVFGSAVDAIITGGYKEFNERFLVVDTDLDSETALIIKSIYEECGMTYTSFFGIPKAVVSRIAKEHGFWPADKWSDEARYNGLLKKGKIESYYTLLKKGEGKTLLSLQTYQDVQKAVSALKTAPATREYFAEDNPIDGKERFYQLKFKATLNGVEYRCMADLLLVDHKNKIVYFTDLKTSSHYEYDFPKSFISWSYQIQARLYWRIIRYNMDQDDYFKDFELTNCTFLVVCRYTNTPLAWEFPLTKERGTLKLGLTGQIILRDPEDIGAELYEYLKKEHNVPIGVSMTGTNNLLTYLNNM